MEYFFNIHNLFSIQLNNPPADVAEYISRELKYFKSSPQEAINLNINFLAKCELIDSGVSLLGDFHYQDGWLSVIFEQGVFSINVESVLSSQVQVIIEKSLPLHIIFGIIEEIMYLKLLDKNHCMIHAACYKEEKRTILYAALPGTGKTTCILNKCTKGAEFIADDLTIISKDAKAYAYPRAFCIGKYHKEFFNKYFSKLSLIYRTKYYILKLGLFFSAAMTFFWSKLSKKLKIISLGMDVFRIRIEDVVDDLKVCDQQQIDQIRVVFKNKEKVSDNKWDNKRIEDFLILNSNRELIKFFYLHFISFFAYGDALSIKLKTYMDTLFQKQKEIVSSIVKNCDCEIVCINDDKRAASNKEKI